MAAQIARSAVISECGKFRYSLTRIWDDSLPVLGWVMLNPSTADAETDDPTIRRCMNYARLHGFGGIVVVNLFAFRCTDPHRIEFPASIDRVNESHWVLARGACQTVVGAWGVHGHQTIEAHRAIRSFENLECLGTTLKGEPRHPLYVTNARPLEPFARDGIKEAARG